MKKFVVPLFALYVCVHAMEKKHDKGSGSVTVPTTTASTTTTTSGTSSTATTGVPVATSSSTTTVSTTITNSKRNVGDLKQLAENLPPIPARGMLDIRVLSYLEDYARKAQDKTLDLKDARVTSIAEREIRKVFECKDPTSDATSFHYAVVILAYMMSKDYKSNEALMALVRTKAEERKKAHVERAMELLKKEQEDALLLKQIVSMAEQMGGLQTRSQSPVSAYDQSTFYATTLLHAQKKEQQLNQ